MSAAGGGEPSGPPVRRPLERLSPDELAVWRSFLRAHARVMRLLENELAHDDQLPLAPYDVLVQLAEAPDGRLRMTELADRVLLSRSGITRLVDRLARDGLVRREPCADDARGTFAVITAVGIDRLRAATGVHLAGVHAHFVRRFDRRELARLGQLLTRLAD